MQGLLLSEVPIKAQLLMNSSHSYYLKVQSGESKKNAPKEVDLAYPQ